MKISKFRKRFHWGLLPRVQLTISQHWSRKWLGADQATSHHLNQRWLVYWCIYASLNVLTRFFHDEAIPAITYGWMPYICIDKSFMMDCVWNSCFFCFCFFCLFCFCSGFLVLLRHLILYTIRNTRAHYAQQLMPRLLYSLSDYRHSDQFKWIQFGTISLSSWELLNISDFHK